MVSQQTQSRGGGDCLLPTFDAELRSCYDKALRDFEAWQRERQSRQDAIDERVRLELDPPQAKAVLSKLACPLCGTRQAKSWHSKQESEPVSYLVKYPI